MPSRAEALRLQEISKSRARMKRDAAILMQEHIIFRGKMPVLDEDGMPVEWDDVDQDKRIRTLERYIQTAMPNVNPEQLGHESLPAKDAQLLLEDDDALSEMSDEELRELAQIEHRPDIKTENPWGTNE